MHRDLDAEVEKKLRSTPGYQFVASNGIKLALVSDGVLQIYAKDGEDSYSIMDGKLAYEEFLGMK